MANIPIYIPTYINSAEYTPVNVQPRLLFFNGMLDCEKYYIESASAIGGVSIEQTAFPYFDNYNVVTGSFPTVNSKSLLFFNEEPVYGELPDESLYSTYWSNYVQLIYNPRTKLLNASAIIPLADYFDMELNDIVEFRSNYYHLRAINDYNLKNGECSIQLLGPILDDSLIIPRVYYERCMGYSIDNCNDSCTDYYNNCAQFLYEYCLGYSTFNCIEACDDFGNCPTTTTTTTAAPNCDYSSLNVVCNDVTTTTSTTTSTTTTTAAPTTTTSTTSTSTTTSTTTTTTIAPIAINYRIAIPATGNYNYSFTPYSASKWPADFFSPTSSGVLSVINDSTRYAFSPSFTHSFNSGSSIPPILFNAISGSFICDAGLLPYVTQSTMPAENTLCSGFSNRGTGSITFTGCYGGGAGPISANSTYAARVGTFPSGNINPTASFFANGTFNPNPYPTKAGSRYDENVGGGEGPIYKYLNVVVYSPGYATQSLWIPTGTVTQLNGVPIVAGTKIQYWQNSAFDYNETYGGTKTQVSYAGNQYLWIHTYTGSGDFSYRYQNQF